MRDLGSNEDSEPTHDGGWGFCWDDPSQINCNRIIHIVRDHRAIAVKLLSKEYCVDKLEDNLKVEQPLVQREEFADLFGTHKVFCIGQNMTVNISGHSLYETHDGSGRFRKVTDKRNRTLLMTQLMSRQIMKNHTVNGGPSCFGDSGGPLFTVTGDGKVVLLGVFSFMLWGTCRGRDEPSYYVRVEDNVQWLMKYVSREEICEVGKS